MQAYAVVFTQPAASDLQNIRNHIGQDNGHAAARVSAALVEACDKLEYVPERGRPGAVPGTRELVVVRPHVIVYRIKDRTVEILRIWHGAQHR